MPARRPGSRLQRLRHGRASLSSSLEPVRFPVPLLIDFRSRRWCYHHHRGVSSFRRLRLLLFFRVLVIRWVRVMPADTYRWDRTPFGV